MELRATIPEERIERFIRNVMENFPEASHPCLRCVPHKRGTIEGNQWGYFECKYLFWACEEDEADPRALVKSYLDPDFTSYLGPVRPGVIYVVDYPALRNGFEKLVTDQVFSAESSNYAREVLISLVSAGDDGDKWSDAEGDFDAALLMLLVEYSIFGEEVYD